MTNFKELYEAKLKTGDIIIGDVFFNRYYQCIGEVINLDNSVDEVTIKWDNKKAGTEVVSFKDLKPTTMFMVTR